MSSVNFTDKWLSNFVPNGGREEIHDAGRAGAGLSVVASSTGRKTFFFHYRSLTDKKAKRKKIGLYPEMKIKAARDLCALHRMKLQSGIDPYGDERPDHDGATMNSMIDDYLVSSTVLSSSETHRTQVGSILDTYARPFFGKIRSDELTRRDVVKPVEIKSAGETGSMANRVFVILKGFLNWCEATGRIDRSPMPKKLPGVFAPEGRDRVLTDDEIRMLWNDMCGADGISETFSSILKLQLLTALRSGEISALRESDFTSHDIIDLPGERVKNGRDHRIFLNSMAQEICAKSRESDGEFLFPSAKSGASDHVKSHAVSQCVKRYLELKGVESRWTPHDIRRTVNTRMNELGVQPHIVEAILNHIGDAKKGVAGIYNKAMYDEPKKEAMDLWETELRRILVL